MMMEALSLDVRTFMLAMGVSTLSTAIMCFSFSTRFPKSIRGLSTWSFGLLSVGVSFICFLLRGIVPWFFGHFLANYLILLGVFLLLFSLIQYYGFDSRVRRIPIFLFAATSILLCYDAYKVGEDIIPARTTIAILLTNGFFLFWLAGLIFRNERKQIRVSFVLSSVCCFLLGTVLARRAIRIFLNLEEQSIFSSSPTSQLIFFTVGGCCLMMVSLGFILMAMDRLNYEAMKQIAFHEHVDRLKTLGEMGAGVAHEINNPLAIIKFNLERIKQGLSNSLDRDSSKFAAEAPKIFEMIDKTLNATERVSKIVRGLLMFSKEGSSEPMKPHTLATIIMDTLLFCLERAKSKNIQLNVADCPDIQLFCNPVQISQILLNLLNNSIEALDDVTNADKGIWIDFEKRSTLVSIRVKNSGPLISLENRKKIFLPFFTTKDVGVGTGLGLSIALGIAERHNGRLYLDEASTQTCFVLELPIRS